MADLHGFPEPGVREIKLEHLSNEAGAELLTAMGVTGRKTELLKAVSQFGGHALALNLLGHFVAKALKGDIRRRDVIPQLLEQHGLGGHARRVMRAYDNWLEKEGPERQILRIMGLFDRPAESDALEALCKEPAIAGVTDGLTGLEEMAWNRAVDRLKSLGLLAEEKDGGALKTDCHPLVREHFNQALQTENPNGKKEAHLRLYRYYRDKPEKEFPDTLDEMEPLLAAVAHGCMARIHQEVIVEVYNKRILRNEKHYIKYQLGAFGSELSALWYFFHRPWSQPEKGLSEHWQALALSNAAFVLRALGRLREAIQPMKGCLELAIKVENWKSASVRAGNLSELLLTLGDVSGAIRYGEAAVAHADKSGDQVEMRDNRTALADALHQAGRFPEAGRLFREAEEMQRKRQPQFHFLYSMHGISLIATSCSVRHIPRKRWRRW